MFINNRNESDTNLRNRLINLYREASRPTINDQCQSDWNAALIAVTAITTTNQK